VFSTQPTAHWWAKLDKAGVPGGPVYTYEECLEDPHIVAREMVVEMDHPTIGRMKAMGHPVKSSGELTKIRMPAPLLGQHTGPILEELGFGADEVAAMFSKGAVFDSTRK
jgi:crotonobetainyl-CoA:carnitine CoA-transferase CaiB-like acyl-CoA transferase